MRIERVGSPRTFMCPHLDVIYTFLIADKFGGFRYILRKFHESALFYAKIYKSLKNKGVVIV